MSRLRRVARSPSVHFAVLGGLLFVADGFRAEPGAGASEPSRTIVVTQTDVAQLRRGFAQEYGREPSASDEQSLVEREIDDEILYRRALEIGLDRENKVVRDRLVAVMRMLADDPEKDAEALYREAIALGLDRSDVVVRRHLVQLMTLILRRAGETQPIADEDLRRELDRDADRFRLPPVLTLTHVYFDPARRGTRLEADAAHALAEVRAGRITPAEVAALGDPFVLAARFARRSEAKLRDLLGAGFAEASFGAPVGVWSGPVRSPYGLHLVLVEERIAGRLPALGEVRNQLAGRVRRERGEAALRAKVAELRAGSVIRVEPSGGEPAAEVASVEGVALPVPPPVRELGD